MTPGATLHVLLRLDGWLPAAIEYLSTLLYRPVWITQNTQNVISSLAPRAPLPRRVLPLPDATVAPGASKSKHKSQGGADTTYHLSVSDVTPDGSGLSTSTSTTLPDSPDGRSSQARSLRATCTERHPRDSATCAVPRGLLATCSSQETPYSIRDVRRSPERFSLVKPCEAL